MSSSDNNQEKEYCSLLFTKLKSFNSKLSEDKQLSAIDIDEYAEYFPAKICDKYVDLSVERKNLESDASEAFSEKRSKMIFLNKSLIGNRLDEFFEKSS